MERAIITISESGNVNIPDGDVWMSFAELVGLFDVAVPTLKAAIRAIHKSGVIAEHTQHCEVIPYTYWATLYNMDMIVALAFRINIRCREDTECGVKEDMRTKRESMLSLFACQFSNRYVVKSAYRLISQQR